MTPEGTPPSGAAPWTEEEAIAALAVRAVTHDLAADPGPPWPAPGGAAAFLARHFRPDPPQEIVFTGYYEPVVEAALARGGGFDHPLYALPEGPRPSRAEIAAGALAGRGLELAWLRDPLEAFLLQVQGSARLAIAGGGELRLGHAGGNGRPYRSIGAELIRRGAIAPEAMGIAAIRAWARAHPAEVPDLLLHNPSFAFFRPVDLPPASGPIGAMGRPVTAGRSLAVDPAEVPLGALVWVEFDAPIRLRRLMVAQDTGGAIRGARADIFTGTGRAAGRLAGRLRHPGRLAVLRPVGA